MVNPKIKVSFEGKPLEVLNELLQLRSNMLKKHIKNATAAAMVNALKSIRAATHNALNTNKINVVVQDTGYYGGFSSTTNKPCVRQGPLKNSP